jgi:hypothetical protein
VTNGLILLGFIGVIFAIVIARVRRQLGMSVTGRFLAITVSGFAIAVLVLWATTTR